MVNTLFLQSDVSDPYALYATMRAEAPVHFDEANGVWALYDYASCKRMLETGSAHIPAQNPAMLPLINDASRMLVDHFARLANPPAHAPRREAAMCLMGCMRPFNPAELLDELVQPDSEIEWVHDVAKTLPVMAVLRAFDVDRRDASAVLPHMEHLTKIMLPNKPAEVVEEVNAAADAVLAIVERHVSTRLPALAQTPDALQLHAANLAGLLVQSVDAGRGLLSNALLQALRLHQRLDAGDWQRLVVETLRYDPPIQNTRRVLTEALTLGDVTLPGGASVLVVLASANRDEAVFAHGDRFDMTRANNAAHLTFGAGAHVCAAHRFAANLAADTLQAFFRRGRRVELLQDDIAYEPMVNARLPREIRLRYSS